MIAGIASFVVVATLATGGLLSLESAEGASLVNGGWRELDVLLGGGSHHVRWDVDELFSNRDVSLSDEDSGVVKRFGVVPDGDLSLQSSLHELCECETEDVIELSLILLQQAELAAREIGEGRHVDRLGRAGEAERVAETR